MENWKDIKGYEGLYQISNEGRVRSLIGKEKILKPLNTIGYFFVRLSKDKIIKNYYIHRLIATHFLDNPDNKPQVNHINGIKTDNRLSNLEWNTRSENMKHADDTGLRNIKGSNHGQSKLTDQQVLKIRSSNLKGKELSKIHGVSQSTISLIKNRKKWCHI